MQLRNEFWPNGLNKPSVLDYTQYWLVYETEGGDLIIIDGNHRKILLEECGIKLWPCRWIPKEAVSIHFLSVRRRTIIFLIFLASYRF